METTTKKTNEAVEEKDKKAANIKENVKEIEEFRGAILTKAKEKEK